jgi:hypothetical protein
MMYPINEQVVSLLTNIRHKIEAKMESWGPEAVDQPDNSTAKTAFAGDGGAENPTDANDALNMYLVNLCDRLMSEFGMGEDEALDFIFSCADEMTQDGELPPLPEDDAADQEVSVWLGKANSSGFGAYVLGRARG